MFLGCPKETDDLYYLLPNILKDRSNTKLWNKWVGSACEYANVYVADALAYGLKMGLEGRDIMENELVTNK